MVGRNAEAWEFVALLRGANRMTVFKNTGDYIFFGNQRIAQQSGSSARHPWALLSATSFIHIPRQVI